MLFLTTIVLPLTCCISVSYEDEVLESSEISREEKIERSLLSSEIQLEDGIKGKYFVAKVTGKYSVKSWVQVTKEQDLYSKLIVLGFFPGVGNSWWAGKPTDGQNSYYFDALLIPPLSVFFNVFLLGIPTVIPWFTEFGSEWRPHRWVTRGNDRYDSGFIRPFFSLFGWTKTGKNRIGVLCTTRENEITRDVTEPMKNVTIVVEDLNRAFKISRQSNSRGEARFDLAEFPYLCEKPVSFKVYCRDNSKIETAEVTFPGSELGRDLISLFSRDLSNYDWNSIFTDTGKVDFSKESISAAPLPRVTMEILPQKDDKPETFPVRLVIRNEGSGALHRMVARTKSTKRSLRDHLVVFGKIEKGESISRILELPLKEIDPEDSHSVTVEFHELNNFQPSKLSLSVDGTSLRYPRLVWAADIVDDPTQSLSGKVTGIPDGVIQRGEAVDIVFTVKNTGNITAKDVSIDVDLPSEETISVFGSKVLVLGDIPSDETAQAYLNIGVKPTCPLKEVPVSVTIREEAFDWSVSDEKLLPFNTKVARQPVRYSTPKLYYVESEDITLRTGASQEASVFGRAERNARLRVAGELDDWRMVELEKEGKVTYAWAHKDGLTRQKSLAQEGTVFVGRFNTPPSIVFVEPSRDLVTEKERIPLQVVVTDDSSLRNVELQIGLPGQSPRGFEGISEEPIRQNGSGDSRIVKHELDLPLGQTKVRVVAIDNEGDRSEKTVSITRTRKKGKVYVLCVGINAYPRGYKLQCARQDAEAFHRFALENLGVKNSDATLLVDQNATRRNVMKKFGELRRQLRSEDSLIIQLSGHGMIERDEKFFLTSDSEVGNLFGTAISMDDFSRILNMESEKILVMADVCHSGAIRIRGTEEVFRGLEGKGRLLIGYEGTGREDAALGHGYLTYYLMKAFKGEADLDGNGEITIREAYDYADRNIKSQTGTGLWIKGEGDLILKK